MIDWYSAVGIFLREASSCVRVSTVFPLLFSATLIPLLLLLGGDPINHLVNAITIEIEDSKSTKINKAWLALQILYKQICHREYLLSITITSCFAEFQTSINPALIPIPNALNIYPITFPRIFRILRAPHL